MSPASSLPQRAWVVDRIQESPGIFTLNLRLDDAELHAAYRFAPGQFNMLYVHGVGEVPISISSDPDDTHHIGHTIRPLGRVTQALATLKPGDALGLRGSYGRGWPLQDMTGKDVVLVMGGLGCAPVVSVIHYLLRRREQVRRIVIMQGVKHADDLIWREQYQKWAALPDVQVLLAASQRSALWPWHVGRPTELFEQARFDPANAIALMCGPEGMMKTSAEILAQRGVPESNIHLSMERNMQCATGHCGHCQIGPLFVCKDGPVFAWPEIKALIAHSGF